MSLLQKLSLLTAAILLAAPASFGQSISAEAPADHPSSAPDLRGQILHEQVDGSQTTGIISQYNETATQFDTENADDFMVPDGETWAVTSMYVRGFFGGPAAGVPPTITNCPEAHVFVWEDDFDSPGEMIAQRTIEPVGEGGEMIATFEEVVLGEGHYWVSFVCFGIGLDSGVEDRWNWFVNANETNYQPAHIRNENGGFGDGAFEDWTSFDGLGFPGTDLDWYIAGQAGVSSEGGAQPLAFSLLQNFPNPAVGSTEVQFMLDETADITVTVYDALGRQVMQPFSGTMTPGQQNVTVDVSGLPVGTYFYRVQSGDQMMVRKMTVLN